jgi:hypothetical protein
VDAALYLIAPYREPLNKYKEPSGTILSSPGENLSQTENIPELKLHYFDLPATFTGGEILIQKNNCLELRYFFSKQNNVVLNWRDGIGGFYELMFLNNEHDYTKSKSKQDQSKFVEGATLNITQDLIDIQSRFGNTTNNYLYFFCPFVKVGSDSAEFEVQVILNKNPTELKDKDELEDKIVRENEGDTTSAPPNQGNQTPEQKIIDIIKQVKGDGQVEGVKKRMQESPSKYYEVIQRDVSVDVWAKESSDVKTVSHIINLTKVGHPSGIISTGICQNQVKKTGILFEIQ